MAKIDQQVAVVKSLVGDQLNLKQLEELMALSDVDLMIEHGLTDAEAEKVLTHAKREMYRMRAQGYSFGNLDAEQRQKVSYTKPPTRTSPISESNNPKNYKLQDRQQIPSKRQYTPEMTRAIKYAEDILHPSDVADLEIIFGNYLMGDFKAAYRKAIEADSIVRDVIPNSVWSKLMSVGNNQLHFEGRLRKSLRSQLRNQPQRSKEGKRLTEGELKEIIKQTLLNESPLAGAMPLIGIGALGGAPMSARPMAAPAPTSGRDLDYREPKEGRMMKANLYNIAQDAMQLCDMLHDDDDLPQWTHEKVATAHDRLNYVREYLEAKIVKHEG